MSNWYADVAENSDGTLLRINGSEQQIEPGTPFKDTIKEASLNAGFGKYRVFLNGDEIKPSEAPATINLGDNVEVKPYDVAGR